MNLETEPSATENVKNDRLVAVRHAMGGEDADHRHGLPSPSG
jgi:hypothetical protein